MPDDVPDGGLTVWLAPLKGGDPEAVRRVWEAAFPKLVALARKRLHTISRAAADEEDLALSAFASFCRGVEQGRFPRLDDRTDLWQVLLMLVHRKAVTAARRESRAKRGGGRTVQASAVGHDETADPLASVGAGDPTPEAAALVAEECDRLLKMLSDPTLREVAVWKMEGYTNAEIAKKIGRVEGTVERKLAIIRLTWEGEIRQ
jgi:DNA-directed RNA polymerase specialized sigma24 family protein